MLEYRHVGRSEALPLAQRVSTRLGHPVDALVWSFRLRYRQRSDEPELLGLPQHAVDLAERRTAAQQAQAPVASSARIRTARLRKATGKNRPRADRQLRLLLGPVIALSSRLQRVSPV